MWEWMLRVPLFHDRSLIIYTVNALIFGSRCFALYIYIYPNTKYTRLSNAPCIIGSWKSRAIYLYKICGDHPNYIRSPRARAHILFQHRSTTYSRCFKNALNNSIHSIRRVLCNVNTVNICSG